MIQVIALNVIYRTVIWFRGLVCLATTTWEILQNPFPYFVSETKKWTFQYLIFRFLEFLFRKRNTENRFLVSVYLNSRCPFYRFRMKNSKIQEIQISEGSTIFHYRFRYLCVMFAPVLKQCIGGRSMRGKVVTGFKKTVPFIGQSSRLCSGPRGVSLFRSICSSYVRGCRRGQISDSAARTTLLAVNV